MRVGSLFSGYGGLDSAVLQHFDGQLVFTCENDPSAARVLALRHPGVPNLGDIKAVDWADAPAVDVLCGGYPCQPFSNAGKRRGVDDQRHLWPYFAAALRHLRPRYAVLENVRGHLGRGFTEVLWDLAALGFDACWGVVRASDTGAPHRRERLFVVAAHPAGP